MDLHGALVEALIFDMDGTMIDSMPSHKQSWAQYARRQGLSVDIVDFMNRTTGRTGAECIRILLGKPNMAEAEALVHVHAKESVYRELFEPIFAEAARRIEAARRAGMRAVGIASSHHPDELRGPHVLAVVPNYHALMASQFLEIHHVATS
jgi:beta-phosphoglucomutase-like phosphatase (HAD superfamily)